MISRSCITLFARTSTRFAPNPAFSRPNQVVNHHFHHHCHHHRQLFLFTSRPQSTMSHSSDSSTPARISDEIKHDHRELEEYYERIVSSADTDEQTRYQNIFTWELARHSVGEELVVYPFMEGGGVEDGKALVKRDLVDHQKVKEQLYKFQSLSAGQPDFLPTLKALMADLSQHMKEEEETDLVKLEEALSPEASQEMAKTFMRTKKFVPTRSHPGAPDRPPFETIAALMSAPLDKLTDLLRSFPE